MTLTQARGAGGRAGRAPAAPAGGTAAMMHLQRTAGNAAVGRLLARRVWVQGPTGDRVDLIELLKQHKLDRSWSLQSWFDTEIRKGLIGRFGFDRFNGYVNHAKEEYSFTAPVDRDPGDLTYQDLTDAIRRALNNRILAAKIETGHSSLGSVKLLGRGSFAKAIKESYDKSPVIKELQEATGTQYEAKQIHLRHFVMGSWFRALPGVVASADLNDSEQTEVAKWAAGLIPRVAPWAGVSCAVSTGSLEGDLKLLATLLHDLLPNLNAGAGPENTIIGFVSNGLSNLAEDIRTSKITIARDDAEELVETAIDGVTIVSTSERENFKANVKPGVAFSAIIDRLACDADPIAPDTLSLALHEFSFQLGMDFMKHEVGRAQSLRTAPIAVLQGLLFPVGQALYGLILDAQTSKVDKVKLAKFFGAVESAIGEFEKLATAK